MVAGGSLPSGRDLREHVALSNNGRVKGLVSTARRRLDAAWAAVEERRPRVRSVDATLSAYERDRDRAGFLLAGALAYRLFLWLLPFTLLIVGGLGFLEASSHDDPSNLADHLGVVGLASKSVSQAAADAEHARFFTLLIGIPALYLASLGAIKAFRAVSALAWGVPTSPIRHKPLAVLTCLGFIVAFFTVTLLTATVRHESAGPGVVVTVMAGIGYVWLAFLVLWILPRPPVPWTALLPGAVAMGVGLQAIHIINVYFISYRISTSSETYGALGIAAALLLSLFLISRLFVAGVILNTTLWERGRQAQPVKDPQSPIRGDATQADAAEPDSRPRAGDVSER
jgi:uncharacterized BrkB/YihY/UPF0761 family membrane protein